MALPLIFGGIAAAGLFLAAKNASAGGGGQGYAVDDNIPYGNVWKKRRPPGLPPSVRKVGTLGSAKPLIRRYAPKMVRDPAFLKLMLNLCSGESNCKLGLPARNFDARCGTKSSDPRTCTKFDGLRGKGELLQTAWGTFQWMRAPFWELTRRGSSIYLGKDFPSQKGKFPWDYSPEDEVRIPMMAYAVLWKKTRAAGGDRIDAARAVRLWHQNPSRYKEFVRRAKTMGWKKAWKAGDPKYARVDNHLRKSFQLSGLGGVHVIGRHRPHIAMLPPPGCADGPCREGNGRAAPFLCGGSRTGRYAPL